MPTPNEILLEEYRAAEIKILKGQSVRLGDRELRYADLETIRKERRLLERAVANEQSGGRPGFATADFGGVT
ncbi:MAG: hypothetical protein ACREO8_09135 [Luteimonas sp.]